MKVVNQYGRILDWDAVVELMDDEIREQLHDELDVDAEQIQTFFVAYCDRHLEEKGETFEPDKQSPQI